MKLKFLGATGTVTGSKYLLSTQNEQFLVDCGLFQGLKDLRLRNWRHLETDVSGLKAVMITHAHIDHTGYLPRLIKLGFRGKVYCSQGTYELSKILLPDSGYLQEEEAFYANKKGYTKHNPAEPLYTREEAEEALNYFHPVNFHEKIPVGTNAWATFYKAGHILGASSILFEAQGRSVLFSGDVGRYNDLIMRAPESVPNADYVVMESTYGDRQHVDEGLVEKIAGIINDVAKKKGTIVIPAFAIGRAQHLLFLINKLKKTQEIPNLKTYLDSPMAINATSLYCQYHEEHRLTEKMCEEMCADVILTKTSEQSKAINNVAGPKIIISASGMASGGRIVHHLAQYISHAENAIILVGYQAAGTRGRALLEGIDQIKMFGEIFNVKARIEDVSGLSAHADYTELLRWLAESKLKNPHVFLTHGELASAESLRDKLVDKLKWRVEIPADGDEVLL